VKNFSLRRNVQNGSRHNQPPIQRLLVIFPRAFVGKISRTHRRVAPRVRKSRPVHLISLHVVIVWTGKALPFTNVLQTPHYELFLKNRVVS